MTVFEDARRLVSARSAAEFYGFTPNRAGYIPCPFHAEKTASLKLYDDGGWHCFGCRAGGSSIDFVAKMFDLSPLDAVRRMNADFSLALPLDRPPSAAQQRDAQHQRELMEVQRDFEAWRDGFIALMNEAYRTAHLALRDHPEELTDGEALAVRWQSALEHWCDCLMLGGMAEQMQIFRERREIGSLCGKILHRSQKRSSAA